MRNVKCCYCKNLKNEWCEKILDSPYPELERDCQYFCHKTNLDHFRSLSAEKIAIILAESRAWNCYICMPIKSLHREIECDHNCYAHCLDWLNQEYIVME